MIACLRPLRLLALTALCMTLCGAPRAYSTDTATGKGTVYYLAPTLFDEFQTESMRYIETTFGSIGYKVTTLDAQNRADLQLNQLDNVIIFKPAAVVIAAVDYDSVLPGIDAARAAGIRVLVYDRQITGTRVDFTSVVGTVEIGRISAAEVLRLLNERRSGAEGLVLQITGDPGDSYTLDIQKGFDEEIATYPGVRVITKAAMQWEPTNAGDIVENQLLVNEDIDLIFVHAAHLAVPIVGILEARGRKPGQVMMASTGGLPVGLELIRQGWIQVDVEQPLYAQIRGMAMFMDKIIAGDSLAIGNYEVTGLQARLVSEKWGPTLVIPGRAVSLENVEETRFWGNQQPPADLVKVLK
jgi:ribose transport system substrate-binding protein